MKSEVDRIRGGNVWIGACANIQQQPKRTGGSRIEERGNKERTCAGITLCTGYGPMLLFCTKGGRNKWGQRSTEHWSRSVPRTGQIQMKTGGNNEVRLEKGRSHARSTSKLVDVKGEEGGAA